MAAQGDVRRSKTITFVAAAGVLLAVGIGAAITAGSITAGSSDGSAPWVWQTVAEAPTSAPSDPHSADLLVGPWCPTVAGGLFDASGRNTNPGWGTETSGGWTGDGCNGAMVSMPVSGSATKNGANRIIWEFGSRSAGFGTCTASVYVPWDGNASDSGGEAATYTVYNATTEAPLGTFTVNQNASHNRWITLGTVSTGGAPVKMRLLDRGVKSPATLRYGVSAAKLHCS